MNIPKLCSTCKIGKDLYLLDNDAPFCPYMHCHDGCECAMYETAEEKPPQKKKASKK